MQPPDRVPIVRGETSFHTAAPMTDIHALLKLMADHGASDLFLTVGAPPHIKIEGVTSPVDGAVLKRGEVKSILYSLMTERQSADFEATQEANLSFSLDGV